MTEKDLVETRQVESAVEALLKLIKATDKSSVSLIDSGKKIDLQFILTKLPTSRHKIKLDLPHSIDEDIREVCIFVKDLDLKDREYEKTVRHYEALFKEKGVTKIAKIIPIKALRTDYCEPHNKRTLSKAYDLFLADGTIKGFLPALLGKIFYAHKKTVPRQVNLKVSNLKEHLEKVINNPECEIAGKGSSSYVQIGHNSMKKDELVSNTVEAVKTLSEQVPGGRNNIKTLFIRSSETTTIPLYTNYVNPKDIDLPKQKKDKLAFYVDDVTTVENANVYVRSDGVVKVIRNKRKTKNTDDDDDSKEKKPKLEDLKVESDETETVSSDSQKGNKKQKQSKLKEKKKGKGKKGGVKEAETPVDVIKIEDDAEVIEIKEEVKEEVPEGKKKSRKRKGKKESSEDSKKENTEDVSGKKKKIEETKPDSKVLKTSNNSKKLDKKEKSSSKKSPKGKQNVKKMKK